MAGTMIKCKTCKREHCDPFFFCPNCGTALINVVAGKFEDTLEFTAQDWRHEMMIEVGGISLQKISNPRLQPGNLTFQDQDAKVRSVPVLKLYQHIRDGLAVLSL